MAVPHLHTQPIQTFALPRRIIQAHNKVNLHSPRKETCTLYVTRHPLGSSPVMVVMVMWETKLMLHSASPLNPRVLIVSRS